MITKKTVWNTKINKYRKEHEGSHKDDSRKYVVQHIQKNTIKSVLEIGVGSGIFIDNLKSGGIDIEYTGIDASVEFLRVVGEKYPDIKLVKHDCDVTLPFLDNEFELCFARHVIEHIKGFKNIISEMHRVCSREIIVVLFRPLLDGPDQIKFREHKGAYYNSYSKKGMLKLCGKLFSKHHLIESEGNTAGHHGKNWILHCVK